MIPAAILYGLVGGLIPRYRWWSVPVIGVIWSVTLSFAGDPSASLVQIWFSGFVLGALNGAVGVVVSWAILKVAAAILKTAGSKLRGAIPGSNGGAR